MPRKLAPSLILAATVRRLGSTACQRCSVESGGEQLKKLLR